MSWEPGAILRIREPTTGGRRSAYTRNGVRIAKVVEDRGDIVLVQLQRGDARLRDVYGEWAPMPIEISSDLVIGSA